MSHQTEEYFKFLDYESVENPEELIQNLESKIKYKFEIHESGSPAVDPKNWILYIRSSIHCCSFVRNYKSISQKDIGFPSYKILFEKWYEYSTKNEYLALNYLKFVNGNIKDLVDSNNLDIKKSLPDETINLIANNAETAYIYANEILNSGVYGNKKRFLQGENAIFNNSKYTLLYVVNILCEKIPDDILSQVEKSISKCPKCSLEYALKVKKQKFELGEPAIANDPDCSFAYAKDVIGGRFELGEKSIITREDLCLNYAISVIGGKLPCKMHKKMELNGFKK